MANLYETDKLLEEYLLLHYGTPEQVLPWAFGPREALEFPARCVTERVKVAQGSHALEIGCSVGRACFELSVFCDRVVGIDYSQSFVRQAQEMKSRKLAEFSCADEGELRATHRYELEERFRPEKVEFEVGDATDLREDLGSFDIVLACNLLCRVPDPQSVLRRFSQLVKPGGQLVLTSPYTWMEEYTPKRMWLGGFERNGEAIRSLDSLKKALSRDFSCDEVIDMPFLIREHSRKFQWSVAQASSWTRRESV